MEEEASTSHVAGLTPWPTGLRALEKQRKKREEDEESKDSMGWMKKFLVGN
jgi:hypothetical protein